MWKWLNVGRRSRRTNVTLLPDGTNGSRIPPEPVFRGIDFVRQISVPSDFEHSMWGGKMRLTGIDLYKDGLLVRWLFVPAEVGGSSSAAAALISKMRDSVLRDDAGNTFLSSTCASSRSNGVQRFEVSFMPALPLDASSLTISLEGRDFRVALA